MPLCRSCNGTFAREYFIHGNGPRAQICVRCGLEQGLVTKEEVPTFFDEGLIASRLSVVSRRWAPCSCRPKSCSTAPSIPATWRA